MENAIRILPMFALLGLLSCTPNNSTPGPSGPASEASEAVHAEPQAKFGDAPHEWREWVIEAQNRYQEKFGAPTVTHYTYLDQVTDAAYLNTSGAFPRFVKTECEACPVWVQRHSEREVQYVLKGQSRSTPVVGEEPTPISGQENLFLAAFPQQDKGLVRLFVYDLNQKDLAKKRRRKFFDYSDQWRVDLKWQWLPKPLNVTIQRSDGSSKVMPKIAELVGKFQEKFVRLSIYNFAGPGDYKNQNQSMGLYRDLSNGKTTYGAGRFLLLKFPKNLGQMQNGEAVTVDFNFSYNPPCAVSTGFHCPLPQDQINVRIEAGESYPKL